MLSSSFHFECPGKSSLIALIFLILACNTANSLLTSLIHVCLVSSAHDGPPLTPALPGRGINLVTGRRKAE